MDLLDNPGPDSFHMSRNVKVDDHRVLSEQDSESDVTEQYSCLSSQSTEPIDIPFSVVLQI